MRLTQELLRKIQAEKVGPQALVEMFKTDLELYADACLKIQDERSQLIPFQFNTTQQIFHRLVERQRAEIGYVRVIVLKARKMGISTYAEARGFHKTSLNSNTHGKVIAHKDEAVKEIFTMAKRFLTHLPEAFQPMVDRRNLKGITFDNPSPDPKERREHPGLDSSLGVYSANADGLGRGNTLQFLHCSEVAFWDKPGEAMLSLRNAMPSSEAGMKGTEVYLESTANGVGDYFWQEYYRAKKNEVGNSFMAVFLPWYLDPKYTHRVPNSLELTEEENELVNQDHPGWDYINPATGTKQLSLGQIVWRRWAIANQCGDDLLKFRQEYPLTDDEAFVVTGNTFFNADMVIKRKSFVLDQVPTLWRGEMEVLNAEQLEKKRVEMAERGEKGKVERTKLVELPYGRFKIWAQPEKGMHYFYFADVGAGVRGGDFSYWTVLDERGFQAAAWKGHIEPLDFADLIYVLGEYFHFPFGSPEANNHGISTLDELRRLRYPALYRRKQWDKYKVDQTEKEGWMTTSYTRPLMLDNFRDVFRNDETVINDVDVLDEMLTFVRWPNGTFKAQQGTTDDCVMGYAGAAQMFKECRPTSSALKKKYSRKRGQGAPQGGFSVKDVYTGY